jgi:hypothetical protein
VYDGVVETRFGDVLLACARASGVVVTSQTGPHTLFIVDVESPLLGAVGAKAALAVDTRDDCSEELFWIVEG